MVQAQTSNRPVGIWLLSIAGLIFLMVLVGGVTRLTDSGLSITEWDPIMGAIPPLTDEGWDEAFRKYQEIPEYEYINKGMSLDEFKFIFSGNGSTGCWAGSLAWLSLCPLSSSW